MALVERPRLLDPFLGWSATRLLTRLRRAGHRMPAELRRVQKGRVLVVAPHMDDEVIACGGTLALHQDVGSVLGVIFTSNSEGTALDADARRKLAATRTREAHEAARKLDLQILGVLAHPDGRLEGFEDAIARGVARHLRRWRPDHLFCPFVTDHHRDHQATAVGVARGCVVAGWQGEVWGYEVWSTLWPNALVDITPVVERKRRAIATYRSQVRDVNYIEGTLGLNCYRGLQIGVPWAEGFYVCTAARFRKLAAQLRRL